MSTPFHDVLSMDCQTVSQMTPEQVTPEQVTPEQVTPEQVTSEQAPELVSKAALPFAVSILALLASCGSGGGSGSTVVPVGAILDVDPLVGVALSGATGGPFSPISQDYVVSNTGDEPLNWSLFATESWLDFSVPFGTLDAGDSLTVTITFDQAELATFGAGIFPAVVDFVNDTNGAGNTPRSIQLDVLTLGTKISVSPDESLSAAGPIGGLFMPDTKDYVVENTGIQPASWSASSADAWISVLPASGSLLPGGTQTVTVSIDQNATGTFGLGGFSSSVEFVDDTAGITALDVGVNLSVQAIGGVSTDVVSQHGITWTFDQNYEIGQYANGDFWVVGPVTLIGIDPISVLSAGRIMNGSVINPSPRDTSQGYDNDMFGQYKNPGSFNPVLDVALDVSISSPLAVPVDSSLVSSKSLPTSGARPQLESVAVLTVVDVPPPVGSFRPPYCGSDKTARWNEADLDYSKLSSLTPVVGSPTPTRIADWFERPWIDHIPDWIGRYHHPVTNMPDYGREIVDQVGYASLVLNLDYTDAEKRDLLVRFVQVGIDFWGIVLDGGVNNWPAGGGHHSGRKWPILFGGMLLNDPNMTAIGQAPGVAFNEDDQTFFVAETSPGIYNFGFGGYGPQHVGLPEWGNQHAKNLGQDDVRWFGNPYRTCCTANAWWGEVLAAHVMGARALWNHEPLFDYMDRYRIVSETTGQAQWTIAWTQWPLVMWDEYRDDY